MEPGHFGTMLGLLVPVSTTNVPDAPWVAARWVVLSRSGPDKTPPAAVINAHWLVNN